MVCMICSPQQLLPAAQSPAKSKSSQQAAYKHDSSIPYHVQLKAWPNLAPTHAIVLWITYSISRSVLCVHKQLPDCTVANT